MKTLLALALALTSAFTIVGCSGDSSADEKPAVNQEKDQSTKKDAGSTPTTTQD